MNDATAGTYGPVTARGSAVMEQFLRERSTLNVPWVDSPFFESQLAASKLSAEERGWAQQFHDYGYLVLENFFDPKLLDKVVADYPWLFDRKSKFDVPAAVEKLLKCDVNRIQDAWWVSKAVRKLACDERILSILKLLYGREPIPFQTLNFVTGTEQATHSDAIHFSSLPAGFMCGVWIALEDITDDNGPLNYYPGSQKFPELKLEQFGIWAPDNEQTAGPHYPRYEDYVRAVIAARKLERKSLTCTKGTALIWASNLLHGGCPILKPGTTRLSQVTHFYFERCLYYTPILSNALLGEYALKNLLDVRNGTSLKHTINGEKVNLYALPSGRHRLTRLGGSADIGTLMPQVEERDPRAAPTADTPPSAPPAAPLPIVPPSRPDEVAEVRKTVLSMMEEQARIVNSTPGVDPIQRAQVLAQVCEVALHATDKRS